MKHVGVSPCFLYPDPARPVFGPKTLAYIEQDMARYLNRPGVQAVLIPQLPRAEREALLQGMDLLVLQGGNDIAPQTYGAAPIADGRWPGDPFRDEYELSLIDFAMRQDIPILGICRGFQLLNVYFGGTLLQDIATQRPQSIQHRDAQRYDQLHHALSPVPGTPFADYFATESHWTVNSVHHQGVETLGQNLQAWATATDDGLIEAFGWTGAAPGRVMGVQWHPEFAVNAPVPHHDAEKLYDWALEA